MAAPASAAIAGSPQQKPTVEPPTPTPPPTDGAALAATGGTTTTTTTTAAAAATTPQHPPYWCDLCQFDCRSAVSLQGHRSGRKHRNKQQAINPQAAEMMSTTPGDQQQAQRHLQEQDRQLQAALLESTKGRLEGDCDDEFLANVVDLSRMDDAERMHQRDFDDAVVELALYNYASFHGMEPGKVTFAQVRATSAGIEGWAAAASLGDAGGGTTTATAATTKTETPPITHRATPLKKGDEEEAHQLQMALLESVGARPAAAAAVRPQTVVTTADLYYRRDAKDDYLYSDEEEEVDGDNDDDTMYGYEEEGGDDDNGSEEEEKEDCLGSSADGSHDGESSSAWSLVSHTSSGSSYAMPDVATFSEETTTALL